MAHRRSPGSQAALRAANRARVVQALRGSPVTQSELAERTGLAHATVSNIVRELRERGAVSTAPTVHQGRRASLVTLERAEGPTVVGVDFGRQHVRIAVATDDPVVLIEDEVVLPVGHHAGDSLAIAAARLEVMLHGAGLDRADIAATCVGVPCPVDLRTGSILGHTILPEWDGVTRDRIGEAFGMPVELANDADLGAIAERTFGPYADVDDLIFVKIGTGIGCGLVLGGRLHRGAFGIAGELGHVQVEPGGTLCICGSRGCLETLASVRVMAQSLSEAFGRPIATGDIVRQAIAGDLATRRVVAESGGAIGHSIANLSNLLAPAVIVVGGPLAEVGELLLEPVRDGFSRFALHALVASTKIVGSSLGARAEVLGAVTLARQTVLANAFI